MRFDPRTWFPRVLKIEIVAKADDERYLTRSVNLALICLLEEEWFREGSYASGKEYAVGDVTLRLTYRNRYGPNSFWRLRNRWWRWRNGWGW